MVGVKGDHGVKRGAQIGENGVKGFDLRGIARVAVKNPAVLGVIHGQAILDDLVGQFVRNQLALVDIRQSFHTKLGLVLDVVAEDVTRGNCRNAIVFAQQCGLSALADALGAHDQQSHNR